MRRRGQGLTLAPISAQLELPVCPTLPNLTQESFPNMLTLSYNVKECKPLGAGRGAARSESVDATPRRGGSSLHSSTFQPNLSRLGH